MSRDAEHASRTSRRPRRVEDAEPLARDVPLAALVAYSRVHTGVHYSADVLAGAVMGTALAQLTTCAGDRNRAARTA